MNIMSRNDFGGETRRTNNVALQVLVHAFRTAVYNEKDFIENLRLHDYQCETDWESIQIDI